MQYNSRGGGHHVAISAQEKQYGIDGLLMGEESGEEMWVGDVRPKGGFV